MRMNKNIEYALILVKSLNGSISKLEDIALENKLSLHLLEQVARKLRIVGLIRSICGPGGGYVRVKNVTALEIFNTFQIKEKYNSPEWIELSNKMKHELSLVSI